MRLVQTFQSAAIPPNSSPSPHTEASDFLHCSKTSSLHRWPPVSPLSFLPRWIQELEFTFKALSVAPSEKQHIVAGAGEVAPCTAEEPSMASCKQLAASAKMSIPSCCKPNCWCHSASATQSHCVQLRQGPSLRRENPPAGTLRSHLCQVLKWQADVLCNIYEHIMRPKAGTQLVYSSLISQGPWTSTNKAPTSSRPFNTSVRALKDTTARSWVVHSRLSAGLQIALRQLILSLDSQLQRGHAAVRQKKGSIAKRYQPFAVGGRELTRRPIRILRRELMKDLPCIGSQSLGDEVAQATMPRSGARVEASVPPSTTIFQDGGVSFSPMHEHRQQPGKSLATSGALARYHGMFRNAWRRVKDMSSSKLSTVATAECLALISSIFKGVTASWWLIRQLNRIAQAVTAAGQVAEESAHMLRMFLEEDWACCPFPLEPPRLGQGMLEAERKQGVNGKPGDVALRLMPCSFSPPPSTLNSFSNLRGTAAVARRMALASMSRHVAASLALLRLPVEPCCCSCKQSLCGCSKDGARTCRIRCLETISTGATQGFGGAEPQLESATADTEACPGNVHLRAFLSLTLRHLHLACEEGERLEKSLRGAEKASKAVKASSSQVGPLCAPPVNTQDTDAIPGDTDGTLLTKSAEPLRCLEVYTAIGEDCTNNRRRCQEEAALLVAFTDDDPAVRERSQLILRELEVKLESQKVELQSVPCILKRFSACSPSMAGDSSRDDDASDDLVCITTVDSHAKPEESRLIFPDRDEVGHGVRSNAQHEFPPSSPAPCGEGTERQCSGKADSKEEGVAVGREPGNSLPSLIASGEYVLDANDSSLSSSCAEDRESPDSESLAFLLRQQKLCGRASGRSLQSQESLASLSLMSQLQGVLLEQRRSCGAGPERSDIGTQNIGSATTYGDDASEEEWDSCDFVEGLRCDGKAPIWVAAASSSEDNQKSTANTRQRVLDAQQDSE